MTMRCGPSCFFFGDCQQKDLSASQEHTWKVQAMAIRFPACRPRLRKLPLPWRLRPLLDKRTPWKLSPSVKLV
jgi:hypothetical protein